LTSWIAESKCAWWRSAQQSDPHIASAVLALRGGNSSELEQVIQLGTAGVKEACRDGVTTLMAAAGLGLENEVVDLLAAGAPAVCYDRYGWTASQHAAIKGTQFWQSFC